MQLSRSSGRGGGSRWHPLAAQRGKLATLRHLTGPLTKKRMSNGIPVELRSFVIGPATLTPPLIYRGNRIRPGAVDIAAVVVDEPGTVSVFNSCSCSVFFPISGFLSFQWQRSSVRSSSAAAAAQSSSSRARSRREPGRASEGLTEPGQAERIRRAHSAAPSRPLPPHTCTTIRAGDCT